MPKYQVKFRKSSRGDLKKLKHSPLRKKFDEIVQKLSDNPSDPSDSFERLVPPENNYYSRRLNIQHRVVYSIDEEYKIVYIYSAGNHYE